MGRHKIETEFRLPKAVYKETVWYITQYKTMREQYAAILDESPAPADGQPRGSGVSDQTAAKASKLERLHDRIKPIEDALQYIPEEYRHGVFNKLTDGTQYPDYAERKTWARWRQRYIYYVAIISGKYEK